MIEYARPTESDVPHILAIQESCALSPWTGQAYREAIIDHIMYFQVALSDKLPIGFLLARPITSENLYEILNIAILPQYQDRAIGAGLLTEFFDSLSAEFEHIWLEVREGNTKAISFYRKFGFEVVGTRKNFYSNPTENALLMKKEIK